MMTLLDKYFRYYYFVCFFWLKSKNRMKEHLYIEQFLIPTTNSDTISLKMTLELALFFSF